jgi:hypothetical protein
MTKFRTASSAGKTILNVLWDISGELRSEFFSTDTTSNSELFGWTLQKSKMLNRIAGPDRSLVCNTTIRYSQAITGFVVHTIASTTAGIILASPTALPRLGSK